jgi:putative Ca2+/H+ antiporter (TMEM165/GDT1 family)
MDWRTILSTFGLIFLAELGDKTQLACIGMACRARSPMAVLGAVGALAAVTFIGMVFGKTLANFVPAVYIRRAS